MQEFTTFDIIVIAITILLGLKGLFKGFIKEVFGLVGIIGGLFVASRFAELVGKELAPILNITNESTTLLIGFILTLIGFWILVYIAGMIVSKISEMSGLGIFNRTLGFIFGGAKIFLIFSVVAYLAVQVNAFKSILNSKDTIKNSTTFPLLVSTGAFIFKLDTSKLLNQEENKPEDSTFTKEVKEELSKASKTVTQTSTEVVESVTKEAKKMINEAVEKELSPTQSK